MAMVFKFRALSDQDDSFARDYELRYDSDLRDFHRLICADLGFDPAETASFFLSGPGWEKEAEFLSLPIDGWEEEGLPTPMEGTVLGTVVRKERQRLIYTFDPFSGRSLFLELAGTYKAKEGVQYPCVSFSTGAAPVQFQVPESTQGESIFEEALGELGSFEGDDFYDDEF